MPIKFFSLGLRTLVIAIAVVSAAQAQVLQLGRTTYDTVLPAFWQQATNADRLITGMNGYGTVKLSTNLLPVTTADLASVALAVGNSLVTYTATNNPAVVTAASNSISLYGITSGILTNDASNYTLRVSMGKTLDFRQGFLWTGPWSYTGSHMYANNFDTDLYWLNSGNPDAGFAWESQYTLGLTRGIRGSGYGSLSLSNLMAAGIIYGNGAGLTNINLTGPITTALTTYTASNNPALLTAAGNNVTATVGSSLATYTATNNPAVLTAAGNNAEAVVNSTLTTYTASNNPALLTAASGSVSTTVNSTLVTYTTTNNPALLTAAGNATTSTLTTYTTTNNLALQNYALSVANSGGITTLNAYTTTNNPALTALASNNTTSQLTTYTASNNPALLTTAGNNVVATVNSVLVTYTTTNNPALLTAAANSVTSTRATYTATNNPALLTTAGNNAATALATYTSTNNPALLGAVTTLSNNITLPKLSSGILSTNTGNVVQMVSGSTLDARGSTVYVETQNWYSAGGAVAASMDANGRLTVTNMISSVTTSTPTTTFTADYNGAGWQVADFSANLTISTANPGAGKSVTVRLRNTSGSPVNLNFAANPSLTFVGGKPTSLAGGHIAVLTFTAFGDSIELAAYAVQQP